MIDLKRCILWMSIFACTLAETRVCFAQEADCALTVEALSRDGAPVKSAAFQLIDASGRVEIADRSGGPLIRICDFGFGPHTLRIGTNGCLPVSVSNIRFVAGFPVRLKVILNSCGYQDLSRSGCLLYLRIKDGSGVPVSGAVVGPGPPGLQADRYGRLQTVVSGVEDIKVTAQGFDAGLVHADCKHYEDLDIEVVLTHSR